jgi:hypothetical protein
MRVTNVSKSPRPKVVSGPYCESLFSAASVPPACNISNSQGETRNLLYIPKKTIAQSLCSFSPNEVYLKGGIAYLCSEGTRIGVISDCRTALAVIDAGQVSARETSCAPATSECSGTVYQENLIYSYTEEFAWFCMFLVPATLMLCSEIPPLQNSLPCLGVLSIANCRHKKSCLPQLLLVCCER